MDYRNTKPYLISAISMLMIAMGTALVTRANMGTVALLCPAYVLSGIHGQSLTFGTLVLIMLLLFVTLECILLHNVKPARVAIQTAQAVAMGLMLDFAMWITMPLQWDSGVAGCFIRTIQILTGTIVTGIGACIHTKSGIQMPADGLITAFAKVLKAYENHARIAGDIFMVVVAVTFCVFYFGAVRWDMIGIGTLISLSGTWLIYRYRTFCISLLPEFISADSKKNAPASPVYDTSDTLPLVITIARTHGSGGHEIGLKVSERLGIKFYDKDIMLTMSSKDEFKYETQAHIIQQISKESCVIIGRCADYVLKDRPYCLNIFARCDEDYAVNMIRNKDNLPESQAREVIRLKDNAREKHYNHYTGQKWKDPLHYDLVINTAKIGIESAVDIVCNAVENILKEEE